LPSSIGRQQMQARVPLQTHSPMSALCKNASPSAASVSNHAHLHSTPMQTQVRFFGSAAVQDDDGQIQPDRMPFAKFSLSALMGSVHSTSAEQARSDGFRGTLSFLALFGWFLAIFLGEYFAVPTATPSQPLVTGLPGCKTLARAYSEAENVATVKSLVITALVGAFFVLPALGLSVVPAHHETLEDSAREVRAFLAVSILALAATAATACSFLAAETQSDGTAALEEVQVRPKTAEETRSADDDAALGSRALHASVALPCLVLTIRCYALSLLLPASS